MNTTESRNFVISIPAAENRRLHITRQFESQNIPFRFFDAFTPSERLELALQQYLPGIKNSDKLTIGEKGCLMSHFILWKKCIDEGWDYITVFEDDAVLGEDAGRFLTDGLWLKERFDFNEIFILRLETFLMYTELKTQHNIPPFRQRQFSLLKSKHFGTAGYIISHAAAKYLTALFRNLEQADVDAVDELIFNRLLYAPDYRVYQLNPAICIQELQLNRQNSCLTSDLEQDRKNKEKPPKPKKTIKQRLKRIKENIIRALNKKRWEEKQKAKEIEGKEIVPFL